MWKIEGRVEIGGWRIIFFFFFQAEDGIRDRDVTGVQTCAFRSYLLLYAKRNMWMQLKKKIQQYGTTMYDI